MTEIIKANRSDETLVQFNDQPQDTIVNILSFLDPLSLLNAAKVSKDFYRLSQMNRLWINFFDPSRFNRLTDPHTKTLNKLTLSKTNGAKAIFKTRPDLRLGRF